MKCVDGKANMRELLLGVVQAPLTLNTRGDHTPTASDVEECEKESSLSSREKSETLGTAQSTSMGSSSAITLDIKSSSQSEDGGYTYYSVRRFVDHECLSQPLSCIKRQSQSSNVLVKLSLCVIPLEAL